MVPYVLIVPPVGIVTAWLVQHENPTLLELVGGAVMLAGVAAATITRRPTGRSSGSGGADPAVEDGGGSALVHAVGRQD